MDPIAIYSALPFSGQHTRLLKIRKAVHSSEKLLCELVVVDLGETEHPPFAALSYVWGDPSVASEEITLNEQAKIVGANLAVALRFFRDRYSHGGGPTSGYIWVDALCINQNDNDEKTVQVRQMDSIYRNAAVVIAHLRSDSDGQGQALKVFSDLSDAWQNLLANCRRDDDDGLEERTSGLIRFDDGKTSALLQNVALTLTETSWSLVQSFLSLSYWTRIWIVQEVVLGSKVLLVLGNSTMTWTQLTEARTLLRHIPELLDGLKFYHSSLWNNFLPSTAVNWNHIDLITQLKEEHYLRMEQKVMPADVLKVLARTCTHRATDARDLIFGLGGLCHLYINPNYEESIPTTFGKFGVGCVLHQHLNVILWAGTGLNLPSIDGFPSWIPNWESISKTGWKHPIDPAKFHADGWLDPFPGLPPPGDVIVPGVGFRIHGRTCDTVSAVEPGNLSIRSEQMFQACVKLLQDLGGGDKMHRTGVPNFQALMRTLYLDHEFDDDDTKINFTQDTDTVIIRVLSFLSLILPEDSFHENNQTLLSARLEKLGIDPGLAFAQSLKRNFWPSGKFDLVTEMDFNAMSDEELMSTFPALITSPESIADLRAGPPLCRRGVDVLSAKTGYPIDQQLENRIFSWTSAGFRLFRTISGYIGIGPPGMEQGDVVCVLRRCTTPVVLRRVGEQEKVCELVGSCFVLGLMEGEGKVTIELIEDYEEGGDSGCEKLVDDVEEFFIQ